MCGLERRTEYQHCVDPLFVVKSDDIVRERSTATALPGSGAGYCKAGAWCDGTDGVVFNVAAAWPLSEAAHKQIWSMVAPSFVSNKVIRVLLNFAFVLVPVPVTYPRAQ